MDKQYMELSELQDLIGERIGFVEQWVRVEIESHREVGGHHYFNFIEKRPGGEISARVSGRIWRSNSGIIREFVSRTGQKLEAGITVVVLASVDYHPQYGLTLVVEDIDSAFTVGQRELERLETLRRLEREGLLDAQKELGLPYLPSSIAVVSSSEAAGYGDFMKHLQTNSRGFRFNCTLFNAVMQGDKSPASVARSLKDISSQGGFDVIVIMRGGGADSDMFCFDDYGMCRAIAECDIPVLTAIGHERDSHLADMVANLHFKTPTALADALVEWVADVEDELFRSVSTIKALLASRIAVMEKNIALLEAGILAADPRNILKQGYVLAVAGDGSVLKNVNSASEGDKFSLRFSDGRWDCSINKVTKEK